jgi:LasA protease
MPQHRVGRWRGLLRRALVAVLVLVLAGSYVPSDLAPSQPDRALTASVEAAARKALGSSPALSAATAGEYANAVVVPAGGRGQWQTGTFTLAAWPGVEGDEPRVYLYVAQRQGSAWTAAIEGSSAFAPLATRALATLSGTSSADLLSTALASTSGDGSARLSLPWKTGKTWRLTGGPHSFRGGSSRPWSSLDFAGPTPGVSTKVRAARRGVVVRPCANLVQVRHGNGWTTSYYHLKNIAVRAGQTVSRGQFLGYTSKRARCGGSATGKHVHFSLLRSGSYVNIRGHAIGGWTVKEGSSPYEGCLVKGDKKRCAPNGSIHNNGTVGSG